MERVERFWFAVPGDAPAASERMTEVTRHADAGAPYAAQDDAALVAATLAGAREAFDAIVARHQRAVYQLCYRFVGNHDDASDAAQEVFLRAYRGLRNFKGDAAFGTWLHRIAVNACLNRVSARTAVAVPLEFAEVAVDRRPDAASQLLREERSRQVRQAIARLPPKQRATLILRVYQELSHQEIADVVGSSVGAVKANFFHALRNLKRLLSGEGGDGMNGEA